jgi:flagellar biosynthesis protein FliQ
VSGVFLEHSLYLLFGLSLLLLGVVACVGFFVALFQAATQIQDQTLLFVPKCISLVVVLFVLSGYIGEEFSTLFFESMRELTDVRPWSR